ncbi:MAG: succinylglutamate desuccinylase/aspartoacylase family protein [Burkholderiaceae bacterium]|nr:succinylglutamate desuccinylase/aspartoacylase family protein [Burkholderiaceae bacterium]
MTMQTHSGSALRERTTTPRSSALKIPALLAATALLSACATTPLPTWTRIVKIPPPVAQRTTPVPTPLGQPVVEPLPEPTTAPTVWREASPESAPVAARFPDPDVRYETPGLAAQRHSFTTNAESDQWLRDLTASALPTRAALLTLGASQRGASLHALVLTRAKGTDPNSLAQSNRPTVLLIGQQHGDEPAGSEALLVIAQELARGTLAPLLEQINVVVVPRANPDGAQSATRATANGADMNRDHLLLHTPEAQALAVLVHDYRPTVVIDAQEYPWAGDYLQKFNALPRSDVLLQYAGTANVHEFLLKASREWYYEPMLGALRAQGLSTDWYHAPSAEPGELRLAMGGTQPHNARNVNGLKNAISLVVATRGIGLGHGHIQRRVHAQVTAIGSALRSTAERAEALEQVHSFVVRETEAQVCKNQMSLSVGLTLGQRDVVALNPDTGADQTLSVQWDSALSLRPLQLRTRPCGYWLADSATKAVERLRLLGVRVLRVAESGAVLAEVFQEVPQEAAALAEGALPTKLVRSAIDTPANSYYVPLNQPLANLVVAALEADTPDSYFSHRLIDGLADSARVVATPTLIFDDFE